MSDISKRIVFVDHAAGDCVRYHEWAKVFVPVLGMMYEPFVQQYVSRGVKDLQTINYEDPMRRIDGFENIPMDKHWGLLGDGTVFLHGGFQVPRTGR